MRETNSDRRKEDVKDDIHCHTAMIINESTAIRNARQRLQVNDLHVEKDH